MVWDLRGVVIEFDASVMRLWGVSGPHNYGSVFGGNGNVWRGLTWRDVAPAGGGFGFFGGISFVHCGYVSVCKNHLYNIYVLH